MSDISPHDFPDINLEDTPLYDMYDDDTMYTEGGLSDNIEYNNIPLVANGFNQQVPTP